MAGLQQYNFFPTDLFYPRPQPSPSSLESASAKPSALPFQDPRPQEQQQKKPQHPSKYALLYNRKKRSVSMSKVEKRPSRYSINPLSLVALIEDGDDFDNI
ncbi:uncharacterized protein LOC129295581 [Prosopis cineraria]|uniref:uncharacterized protein LOC129295581 n=1 Tax=Prosopis cineraria TaxID=364024 RepID=UPI00240F88D2|nr:uncharacterized protein LOC129295581 [Prosopis cineraria]